MNSREQQLLALAKYWRDKYWSLEEYTEENDEEFTPHSFLKWELDGAFERRHREDELSRHGTKRFWEGYHEGLETAKRNMK